MNRPEEDLQRTIVEWLRWNRRRWEHRMLWFAVPNQKGTRSRAEMGVLQASGVEPGVADLVFVGDLARVLFVELKAPGREGRLSADQREFLERCTRLRIPYRVESTLEDVIHLLTKHELLDPERPGRDPGQARLPYGG